MSTLRSILHGPVLRLCGICLTAALTACSDDLTDTLGPSSRQITFAVAETGPWSRSASADGMQGGGVLPALTLTADTAQLYLIPDVRPSACVAPASRGMAVAADGIDGFGVFATTGPDAEAYYMENVEVTRAASWAPAREYLWPGSGSLHITAYSPYSPDASPMLAYTVPDDVPSQSDLMWASPVDASASPCALTFNHALAAVRFAAGPEMSACTVRRITISGVPSSGTLDIATGQWSDVAGNASFTANIDVVLAADGAGQYVAERTAITDSVNTFMLLPQTLGKDASVALVIEVAGVEHEFTAPLAGQTWQAGYTYTYLLSASADPDRFVLTVDSPLTFNYTGGRQSYTVTSRHETASGGSLTSEEVPWTAEFVDADGNAAEQPAWVSSIVLSGSGTATLEAVTQMVEPTFFSMSDATRRLRQAAPLGSENSPWNLSNSTGAATVENTANCYVINAPGVYSLPLVYGNAIRNGADNTAAYVPTRSRQPFVNHLGNRIQHPYIPDNTGCADVTDAVLVWEGRLNLVRDVRLSADGRSIVFDVPPAGIRQGNAVVAVRDSKGDIMWSWQLWLTDYVPGTDMHRLTYNGTEFSLMPRNLGRIIGGDRTDFPEVEAFVRFTQHPADGSIGQSVTVALRQVGKKVETPDCHSFYQWGRKDPMISGIKEWYYADHTEITDIETQVIQSTGSNMGNEFDTELIRTPQVFWIMPTSGNPSFTYTTQWNTGTSASPVKTVYDPCPPGFRVPSSELMLFRDAPDSDFSFSAYTGFADPAKFIFSGATDASTVTFPALGYRSGSSGHETLTENGAVITELWTSHANRQEATALILKDGDPILHRMPTDARLEAFAVRPVAE